MKTTQRALRDRSDDKRDRRRMKAMQVGDRAKWSELCGPRLRNSRGQTRKMESIVKAKFLEITADPLVLVTVFALLAFGLVFYATNGGRAEVAAAPRVATAAGACGDAPHVRIGNMCATAAPAPTCLPCCPGQLQLPQRSLRGQQLEEAAGRHQQQRGRRHP